MSTSPTEPDINSLDLNELRRLLKDLNASLQALKDHNAQLEKDKSDAELNSLAQNTTSFSPFAANLLVPINAAAQIDARQVMTQVKTFCLTWKLEFCLK